MTFTNPFLKTKFPSLKLIVSKSTINWVGKKVTGEHSGTINFKEGNLVFNKGLVKAVASKIAKSLL
jgi:hypothetical protein